MKRAVSLVAFLVIACAPLSLAAGCSGAPAGKAEFAQACHENMGGKMERCTCYVDAVEKELTPEQFATVAQGAYNNRGMSSMVPRSMMDQPFIGDALLTAAKSCLA